MAAASLAYLLLLTLSACSTPALSTYHIESKLYEPNRVQKSRLHFFLHDTLSGKNPTAVKIAGPAASKNETGPTPFGTVFAIDDQLTEGPNDGSTVIGNAQGMYLSSSKGDLTLVMYVDMAFTAGEFNGSSLSVFSRNPVLENPREMAIVGGRGKFRRAQGTVFVKTFSLNTTNGDAVLEYEVEVFHPEGF